MKKNEKIKTISEYGELSLSELNNEIDGNVVKLIRKINKSHKTEFFKITDNKIKATQYVGFVKIKNCTIQVVPKILDDDVDNVHFLIQLLKYTKKLNVKEQGTSGMNKLKGDFPEILINLFAKNLKELLKMDLKKNYVLTEDNLSFLKGKLMIKENLKENRVNKTKYYCKYDEFTENNMMNQIFKFVTTTLLQITNYSVNKHLLEDILSYLSEVDYKHIKIKDFDKIHITRLNKSYEPIINLCRLFIQNSSIEFSSSKIESFIFLFDMNILFEEFIFRFIKKYKSKIKINICENIELVKEQHFIGKLFNKFHMKVDILLRGEGDNCLLIDTKYKILNDDKTHQGVSSSDMYQMFAYSTSQKDIYEDIILLYPANKKIKESIEEITMNHDISGGKKIRVHIRTIELSKIYDAHNKKIKEPLIIEELNKSLNVSKN